MRHSYRISKLKRLNLQMKRATRESKPYAGELLNWKLHWLQDLFTKRVHMAITKSIVKVTKA